MNIDRQKLWTEGQTNGQKKPVVEVGAPTKNNLISIFILYVRYDPKTCFHSGPEELVWSKSINRRIT